MAFRLVDKRWGHELAKALDADTSSLRIICPFIKRDALTSLLRNRIPKDIQVITRFNLLEFAQGVSDLEALKLLMECGGRIRGIRNLHAKIFLFGKSQAIITSANLTSAALNRNHEFGFSSDQREIIEVAHRYFDRLWPKAKSDLTAERLRSWEEKIERFFVAGSRASLVTGLDDEGVSVGLDDDTLGAAAEYPGQAFVKFLGRASDRVALDFPIIDEIARAGCHWALGYPKSQRPRVVQDGAIMLMGRLVKPADIRIFGRAIAMRHVPGRDDASKSEIDKLSWKARWSRYVRVHDAEFVAGTMENGISLYEMIDALGPRSFATTLRNELSGLGNTDARKAYSRKPAVQLSPEAFEWLNQRLEQAFRLHGTVPAADLDEIGWPTLPSVYSGETNEVDRATAFLKKQIRAGHNVIFYGPLMTHLGLTWRKANDRKKIGQILEKVSEKSRASDNVLLSVLVHRKNKGKTSPSSGFRKLAERLGYRWDNYQDFLSREERKAISAYQ